MARFTKLEPPEVEALAVGFALGPLRSFRALEAGTINSNFELECGAGRFFLRVNEGKQEPEVLAEAELVAALAAAGVATPAPRPTASGKAYLAAGGRLVSVFPWVDGEHRRGPGIRATDCERLGSELARLHVVGRTLPAHLAPADRYPTPAIAARHRGFAASDDPALADAIALLGVELAWLATRTAARAAAPRGVIHGDLFPDNVLFRGPDVVALIDFEQASAGSLVYDVAVCVNAWCFSQGVQTDLVAALLGGYQAVRPLEACETSLLTTELRAAAARFAVTRITDVYLAHSGVPGKDFRRFLARLSAWQALSAKDVEAWL